MGGIAIGRSSTNNRISYNGSHPCQPSKHATQALRPPSHPPLFIHAIVSPCTMRHHASSIYNIIKIYICYCYTTIHACTTHAYMHISISLSTAVILIVKQKYNLCTTTKPRPCLPHSNASHSNSSTATTTTTTTTTTTQHLKYMHNYFIDNVTMIRQSQQKSPHQIAENILLSKTSPPDKR